MEIATVRTAPIAGQKPGTSGLRKKTRVFMEPHFLENYVQAIFDGIGGVAVLGLAAERAPRVAADAPVSAAAPVAAAGREERRERRDRRGARAALRKRRRSRLPRAARRAYPRGPPRARAAQPSTAARAASAGWP